MPDLLVRGVRVRSQQAFGRDYHARDAETTLHRTAIGKGLDKAFASFCLAQAFNSSDLTSLHSPHGNHAGSDDSSIPQDRTGTALPFTTSLFRSYQIKILAQHIQ